MSDSLANPGAIILCGGQSRRMAQDKAWLPFGDDASLLARSVRIVVEGIAPSSLIVVAAPDQALPELPGDTRVVRDRWPGEGPLGGLATGLEAMNGSIGWALVCSCDLPLLKPDVLGLLADSARELEQNTDCDAVIPRVEGIWQPLSAIYRRSLLSFIHDLLRAGKRRMTDLLEAIAVREVLEEELREVDPQLLSFRHCNTPAEYEALLGAANS